MKDLSLFLMKNSFSSKLKKGIKSFCTAPAPPPAPLDSPPPSPPPPATLEQMIRRLEMEEAAAKRARAEEALRRRMSAVDSADVLRSARRALDQYPRFSVDGRDAPHRSSFVGATLAGERVVWREPGIVARLMGLDAVPVPARRRRRRPNNIPVHA
ncbi:uncharacterized protein LOC144714518 [Wolffia australiana]